MHGGYAAGRVLDRRCCLHRLPAGSAIAPWHSAGAGLALLLAAPVLCVGNLEPSGRCPIERVALPSLMSMGAVCRLRSVSSGGFLTHSHSGRLALGQSATAASTFILQAVDPDAAKLAGVLHDGTAAKAPPSRVACHLCPIGGGSVLRGQEFVSLQQAQPIITDAIAASLLVAPVPNTPWLRLEGCGGDSSAPRTLSVHRGRLEVVDAPQGGNFLQKLLRFLQGHGRRMAFELEVLESSVVGELGRRGVESGGVWLPLWEACVCAVQRGLGVDLLLEPRDGAEVNLTLSAQGLLRAGEDSGVVTFGGEQVKRVALEWDDCCNNFTPCNGLLVATLAGSPPDSRRDTGRTEVRRQNGGGGAAREVQSEEVRRYVVFDGDASSPEERLVRKAPARERFRCMVDVSHLRSALQVRLDLYGNLGLSSDCVSV